LFHPSGHTRAIRSLIATLTALVLALVAVPAAQAACAKAPTAKAFSAFSDTSDYSLAPAGSFETGATGWSLTGAAVTNGNEPWKLHGGADAKSLAIPATGQAVSPVFCAGMEHPSFRFFARRTSGTWGVLYMKLRWKLANGATNETVVGALSNSDTAWHVSDRAALSTVLPLWKADQTASVQFVFDAERSGGNWAIDDLYIDPYTRG
jgi:hypothetical protein